MNSPSRRSCGFRPSVDLETQPLEFTMLAIPPTHHSQAIETPAQTHPVQRSSDRHSVTQSALARGAFVRRRSARGENGQGTVEYALILVAVAALAAAVVAYLSGPGGGLITELFGAAFAKLRTVAGSLLWLW